VCSRLVKAMRDMGSWRYRMSQLNLGQQYTKIGWACGIEKGVFLRR
jgi:hypothetical protein